MSLIVSGSSAASYTPIEEGTHVGICYMMVDLGMQFSEVYKNKSKKVWIGWEITDETIDLDDGPHHRTMGKQYTASLGESSNLRQDLAAWRGRDFTPQELEAFDLRNIVGAPCLINVVHRTNGTKTYANVQSIMAMPKGMPIPMATEKHVIYDIDSDPVEMVDSLPKFLGEQIKKSEDYQAKLNAPVTFKEIDESDGQLPF